MTLSRLAGKGRLKNLVARNRGGRAAPMGIGRAGSLRWRWPQNRAVPRGRQAAAPCCTDRSGWRREVRSGRGATPPTIPGPLPCRSRCACCRSKDSIGIWSSIGPSPTASSSSGSTSRPGHRHLRHPIMRTVPATNARRHFSRFLRQLRREPAVVTRAGKPTVVFVSMAQYRRFAALRARAGHDGLACENN
jgi:prevent-host-death family protein